ncbi:hypothetical protein HUU05_14550 [candidate division KSB1 bacterium]|nr:hypothetical protein [candidate division KSB1 bacterium]
MPGAPTFFVRVALSALIRIGILYGRNWLGNIYSLVGIRNGGSCFLLRAFSEYILWFLSLFLPTLFIVSFFILLGIKVGGLVGGLCILIGFWEAYKVHPHWEKSEYYKRIRKFTGRMSK